MLLQIRCQDVILGRVAQWRSFAAFRDCKEIHYKPPSCSTLLSVLRSRANLLACSGRSADRALVDGGRPLQIGEDFAPLPASDAIMLHSLESVE